MNTAFVSVCNSDHHIAHLRYREPNAVARLRFSGQAFSVTVHFAIYMVQPLCLVIPLYADFSQLGLRKLADWIVDRLSGNNNSVALIAAGATFRGLPF